MVINPKQFPKYSETHYKNLMSFISPIEEHEGYLVKMDNHFDLGGIMGGKVRQCLGIVYENLDEIKSKYNGGIISGCGLPSPQSTIVSSVANYFGLKCIISSPKYNNTKRDYNRINVSLSQKLGAKIYGVGNPNPSGYKRDVKELINEYGYYEIKFGMNSKSVIESTSIQVQNIPNELENLVVICGSGLNLLGILKGIVRYTKKVDNVYGITLSNFFNENKKLYYDDLPTDEKYKGNLNIIRSPYPYQRLLKTDIPFLDMTYESKSWDYMKNNIPPSNQTLFWCVGIRNYDLRNIEPIKWNKSKHEKELDKKRLLDQVKRNDLHNLKTNITFGEIQEKSYQELSEFIDDLRIEIKERWKKSNNPPTIGKDKEGIVKSFNRLKTYPTDKIFFTDKNYPHLLGIIKNYSKFPVNQFFPSMYDTRIDRQPSIKDFFFNDDYKSRFKRAIVRNVRCDGMYSWTEYLSNPNGQTDKDFFQDWVKNLDDDTGFFMESIKTPNNDEIMDKMYLGTKETKQLVKQGILDDFDFRNNLDFDGIEPSGYMVRYYDKNKKLIPSLLQTIRCGLGTQPAVNYNPLTMRILTEYFLNDQGKQIIYDPSSGWGGRLLGALSSNRNIHYVGTDVNTNNIGCYENLGEFYNKNCNGTNTYEIYYEPAELIHKNKSFQKYKGKISLCITSPPYFGREIYSLDKEQSCIKFSNYHDWLDGYYEPMIKNCYDYLKPRGHLVLNVADTKMSDQSYIPLEQHTIELAVKQGFTYLGNIPMVMSRMIGVKTDKVKNNYFDGSSNKIYKTEPTLCFIKEK